MALPFRHCHEFLKTKKIRSEGMNMLNSLSIKVKFFSSTILAVVIILVLASMNIYSIRQGSSALAEVYEKNV
jgi:hypothetical protein